MSERLYEKILSFFFGFVLLLILFMFSMELFFFYLFTQNSAFYLGYCTLTVSSVLYGTKYFLRFRDFRQNLYLFIPSSNEKTSELQPLRMEGLSELPLKVCLFYRNKATYEEIKQALGLSHPTQVKRELIKGLDILLRNYEKNEEGSVG